MARDHLGERSLGGDATSLQIPPPTFRPSSEEWFASVPFVSVTLDATFYPQSGAGNLALYRVDQRAGEDPSLKHLTGLRLAPFTAAYDVPDMASYWLRAVAAATDWADLIGLAKHFRTTADRARDGRPH